MYVCMNVSATPEDAMQWAAGGGGGLDTDTSDVMSSRRRVFTPDMTDMISLVTNDALIYELTDYYARLAGTPLSEPSERFKRMGLMAKIVASVLRTKNLSSSLDGLDEGDKGYLASLSLPLPSSSSSSSSGNSYTLSDTVAALGLSCAVPGCLLSSLVIARRTSSLEEAVEANILAGGDNCSRAIVVGALWSRAATGVLNKWTPCVKEDVLQEITNSAQEIVNNNQYL